jgi:hypothetical protein
MAKEGRYALVDLIRTLTRCGIYHPQVGSCPTRYAKLPRPGNERISPNRSTRRTKQRASASPPGPKTRSSVISSVPGPEAAQQLGGLHILVNSGSAPGGSVTATGPIETVIDEDLLQDFDVKYVGALRCSRAVIPFMKTAGWGRIINKPRPVFETHCDQAGR